jgi:hypothetical protein
MWSLYPNKLKACAAISDIAARNKGRAVSSKVIGGLIDVLKLHGKTDSGASKVALESCCHAIEALCKAEAANITKFNEFNALHVIEYDVTVADDLSGDKLSRRRRLCVRILVGIDVLEKRGRSEELVALLQQYKDHALVIAEVRNGLVCVCVRYACVCTICTCVRRTYLCLRVVCTCCCCVCISVFRIYHVDTECGDTTSDRTSTC